ncbi:MAG: diguanylate cyclase [Syntrophales bacterium]|jgi:diguanylate cyclase (GGDEF)-like protein/PAS domain S-box-containing protein|nr:diguanylate cyclase [Syntrophales bacterium]MDY0043316.1 diguanylate cyclase [Syntrophales bacterium]
MEELKEKADHQAIRKKKEVFVERRKQRLDRREDDQKMRIILEGSPIPTFVITKSHRIIYWNKAMEALSGINAENALVRGSAWNKFYSEKRPSLADLLVNQQIDEIEKWYPGRWRKSDLIDEAYTVTDFFPGLGERGKWLRCTAAVLRGHGGELFGSIETLEDITDRKNAQDALKKSEEFLMAVLEGSPIPTFVIGTDHKVLYWNKALEEISKIKAETVVGTRNHWKAFYKEERPCMADILVEEQIEEIPLWYAENYTKSKLIEEACEGTDFFPAMGENGIWLRFTAAVLRDSDRMLLGAIETLEDITGRKLAEEALRENEKKYRTLSITDGLTKLYNGRYFYQQLRTEIERSNRYHHPLSILFIDIDNFKNYNDTYGHLEGDEVLVRLGKVMSRCLRKADLAFRFGGEEFTAILPETEGDDATVLAERIRKEFKREHFNPQETAIVKVTVSIGVARYLFEEQFSSVLKRADKNMYRAKELGKDQVFFDELI